MENKTNYAPFDGLKFDQASLPSGASTYHKTAQAVINILLINKEVHVTAGSIAHEILSVFCEHHGITHTLVPKDMGANSVFNSLFKAEVTNEGRPL